jgi:hypothetical protein
MDDAVSEFLKKHPTTARWLDDIVDVLLKYSGKAHVSRIARELSNTYGRDVDTVEQTVTRRINDFCSDAQDFKKDKRHDLFARVEPATYRLRTYPEKPNIIDLIRIEFEDRAMQNMWRWFVEMARKQAPEKWDTATNGRKLTVFVKWISKKENFAEYEQRKAALEKSASDPDLDFWASDAHGRSTSSAGIG